MISPVCPVLTIEDQELNWWGEAILNGNQCICLFQNTIFSLNFKLKILYIFLQFILASNQVNMLSTFSVNVSEICQLWTSDTILHSLCVLLLYIQGFPYSLFLSKRRHFVNIAVYNFLTSAESTLTKKMVFIYDMSNYCSESRPFRLHSAFNLTEFKWHKMPFSWALAGILYISFQWKTFTCKYGLFGVRTNATIMTDEGFWSQFYKLKPWKRRGYLD